MRSIYSIIALLLLAPSFAGAQNLAGNRHSGVVLLSSADAPGKVSISQLNSCYRQLAREWKQDEHSLPTVVVFHVSKKAADAALVQSKVNVRRNHSAEYNDSYYEIWLVGQPDTGDYILAFQDVIEHEFHLEPTDAERDQVMLRVSRVQNATVSVSEIQGK